MMKMVEEIQKVALHPETPLEEKRLHHEAALRYLSYSTEWGQHAGRQLEQAKQTLPLVDLQKNRKSKEKSMIWVLPVLAAVGVGAWIYNSVTEEEQQAQRDWHKKANR